MSVGSSLPLSTLLLAACSGGGGSFAYEDANNYSYTGALTINTVEVAPQSDLTIDWSGLTTDIRGRVADPTAIQQVSIASFTGTNEEIVGKAEQNEIAQSDAQDIYLYDNAGASTAQLADFAITGIGMDVGLVTVDPNMTWFLSLLNLPDGRTDILSSLLLVPTEGSTNTVVSFADDSAKLDVTVEIGASPMTAKEGKVPTFDWSGATKDVFGHEFDDQLADELLIAHYSSGDIAEIEANFLQLDTAADEIYRANAFALRALPLGEALDDSGNAFAGFTADGTWLIGIICTTCTTPIPFILAAVDVQ